MPEMPEAAPQPESHQRRLRIAAMGDMHIGRSASPGVAQAFARVREVADVLVLCGDLTDRGTEDEAQQLGRDSRPSGLPIVAVLGNHDFEAGQPQQVAADPQRRRRPHARRRGHRGAGRRLRRRQGLRRRLRPRRARALGRAGASRRSCRRRVDEALKLETRAGAPAHAAHASRCCTTRRCAAPSRASRPRSSRSSARAGSRSRSTATRSTSSSTATRTAGRFEGRTPAACPSTTSPRHCCSAATAPRRRSTSSS